MTPEPSRRRKLLLAVAAAALFLGAAEGLTRLCARFTDGDTAFAPFRELLVDLAGFADTDLLLEPDPELLWRLKPGVAGLRWTPKLWIDNRSNALRFRDPERRVERADPSIRLLCLGDSCTYGSGVRLADSYPQQLEGLLALAYPDRPAEAWNGGVPGWSSDQGRVLLDRVGAWVRPDVVLFAFGLNDARHWDLGHHKERGHGRCTTDRARREQMAAPAARLDRLARRSAFYRLLKGLLPPAAGAAPTAPTAPAAPAASDDMGSARVPPAEFRDNLERMVATCARLGARPVFVVWPIRWQLEPEQEGGGLLPPTIYQQTLREAGRALDVPVLDLVQALAGARGIYVDSVHMNAEGNRRVAEAAARFLDGAGLLPAR